MAAKIDSSRFSSSGTNSAPTNTSDYQGFGVLGTLAYEPPPPVLLPQTPPPPSLPSQATSSTTTPNAMPARMQQQPPVKMKFSAIWDVEKTPTNCVPRLCRLNVTRLEMKHSPALPELPQAVLLAVKIQGRRRTLRSTEIPLHILVSNNIAVSSGAGSGGSVSIDLNMEFSLTYPHFLKRSNHIEIMLQRKKHYKNRTIPGYKTLAIARLDMNEVLQRSMPEDSSADGQCFVDLLASVSNQSAAADANSNAAGEEASSGHHHSYKIVAVASLRLSTASEPLPSVKNDQAGANKSDDDLSSGLENEQAGGGALGVTDSDDVLQQSEDVGRRSHRRHHRSEAGQAAVGASGGSSSKPTSKKNFKSMAIGQQTKFKQKIVSLLKKMKVSGGPGVSSSRAPGAASGLVSPPSGHIRGPKDLGDYYMEEDYDFDNYSNENSRTRKKGRRNSFPPHGGSGSGSQSRLHDQSLEDLENEIENWAPLSDEDSEGDGVSLAVTVQPSETTPKPSLRPFFFSDLRLSSEQLPFLIDESPSTSVPPKQQNHQSRKQDSGHQHKTSSSNEGRKASNERDLDSRSVPNAASSPPPANMQSPSKQNVDSRPNASSDKPSSSKSLTLKSLSSSADYHHQQQQQQLAANLALSPGIQLEHIFQTSTEMPNHVILVYDQSLANLAKACSSLPDGLNVVCASQLADVDVFFAEITRLIQKFSKSGPSSLPNSASMMYSNVPASSSAMYPQLKLVVCGSSDAFFAAVTQSFVDRFSARLPEAACLVRLLPVPLFHGSAVAQLLGAVSYNYRAFMESTESSSLLMQLQDMLLLPSCLKRQFDFFSVPVGEVLLTIRDKSSGENRGSRQIVLPFICDVQVNIVRTSGLSEKFPSLSLASASSASSSVPNSSQLVNNPVTSILQQSQSASIESQQHQFSPFSSNPANCPPTSIQLQQHSSSDLAFSFNNTNNNTHDEAIMMNNNNQQSALTTMMSVNVSNNQHAASGMISSGSPPPPHLGPAAWSSTTPGNSNIAANTPGVANPSFPVTSSASAATSNSIASTTSSTIHQPQQQQQPSAAPQNPSGNQSSITVLGQASSTQQQPSSQPAGPVLPSPDVASSTSAAFDVNIDYWLDGGSSNSSQVSASTTSQMGSSAQGQVGGPLLMMTSSPSVTLSTTSSTTTSGATSSGSNLSGSKTYNLKGSYRQMVITRSLINPSGEPGLNPTAVTMIMSAKDKKIKKIWLPRKTRDSLTGGSGTGGASSSQGDGKGPTVVESVSRLVCNVKSSSSGHKVVVSVDGVEFTHVKFFQISPAWHSRVKSVPIFAPSSNFSGNTGNGTQQQQQQQQQQQYSLC